MADQNGLSKDQAQKIAAAFKKQDRRVSTPRIGHERFFRVQRLPTYSGKSSSEASSCFSFNNQSCSRC